MGRKKVKKETIRRIICVILCIVMITTEIPISDHKANAATTQTKTKFVKAEPEVFVPSVGEKTRVTFNLERNERSISMLKMARK